MSNSVLHRVDASLRSFYIFNLTHTDDKLKKGRDKILYYHPKDIEDDTKIKDVGLSEGIIAFIDTFTTFDNGDIKCETVNTLKTLQIYHQPEKNYWMVMVINVPKEIRTKNDGVECEEFCNGELHEKIYQRYLEHLYFQFCLQNGTFQMNEELSMEADVDQHNSECLIVDLSKQLEKYFDNMIHNLKLPLSDIIPFLCTMQYLPLSKSLFLRVYNFSNMLKATFFKISDVILLFNDQILNGGKFDPIVLYNIYEYTKDMWLMSNNSNSAIEKSTLNVNRYKIFLPVDLETTSSKQDSSYSDTKWIPHYLYIYRCSSSCLLLFVKINDTFSEEGLKDLEMYIDVQLPLLTNDIHDYLTTNHSKHYNSGYSNLSFSHNNINNTANAATTSTTANYIMPNFHSTTITTSPKYLFINKQTLRHLGHLTESLHCGSSANLTNIGGTAGGKGSVLNSSKRRQSTTFPDNIMNLLIDLIHIESKSNLNLYVENTLPTEEKSGQKAEDTVQAIMPKTTAYGAGCSLISPPEYEETLLKSTEDFWIVKRQCNWRQFYVIIFSKKSTLLNVMEEAERIFENEITDDVFFDK